MWLSGAVICSQLNTDVIKFDEYFFVKGKKSSIFYLYELMTQNKSAALFLLWTFTFHIFIFVHFNVMVWVFCSSFTLLCRFYRHVLLFTSCFCLYLSPCPAHHCFIKSLYVPDFFSWLWFFLHYHITLSFLGFSLLPFCCLHFRFSDLNLPASESCVPFWHT